MERWAELEVSAAFVKPRAAPADNILVLTRPASAADPTGSRFP